MLVIFMSIYQQRKKRENKYFCCLSDSWRSAGSQDSQPLAGFIRWWAPGLGRRCGTKPGGLSWAFWHRTMCSCHQGKHKSSLKMFPPIKLFLFLFLSTLAPMSSPPILTAAYFLLRRGSPPGGTTGRWTWETRLRGMWAWLGSQWAERAWSRWPQRMAIGPSVWGGAASTAHALGRRSWCISNGGRGLWACSWTMKTGRCLSMTQRLVPTCTPSTSSRSPKPCFRFSTLTWLTASATNPHLSSELSARTEI